MPLNEVFSGWVAHWILNVSPSPQVWDSVIGLDNGIREVGLDNDLLCNLKLKHLYESVKLLQLRNQVGKSSLSFSYL